MSWKRIEHLQPGDMIYEFKQFSGDLPYNFLSPTLAADFDNHLAQHVIGTSTVVKIGYDDFGEKVVTLLCQGGRVWTGNSPGDWAVLVTEGSTARCR